MKAELSELRSAGGKNIERISELEQLLASVSIVEIPNEPGGDIAFGARVTVQNKEGQLMTYRIVGVDELDFYSDAVSWISPAGKILLAAELGHQVTLPDIGLAKIVKVEYPAE